MAERPVKRLRRLSTDYDDSEGNDDWIPAPNKGSAQSTSTSAPTASAPSTDRPRRGTAAPASARISHPSPDTHHQSIRLTVKAPPSKLREATSSHAAPANEAAAAGGKGRQAVAVNSRDRFEGGEILSGARRSRNKRAIVEESSEEEDEEEEAEGEYEEDGEGEGEEGEEDEEEEGEEEDDEEGVDDDEDAEGDEDADMDDAESAVQQPHRESAAHPAVIVRQRTESSFAPPQRTQGAATAQPTAKPAPPAVIVTSADGNTTARSVEEKEIAMANDESDDSLSELESQDEEDEDDAEGEEDAEGEDEEMGDEDADVDGSEDEDGISRSATPDLSKLTRRQRAAFEEYEGGLMALSNEAQKKKVFTPEEHAMRRAEMARRRKNLSEKRNEEEKQDTINRLLKKQAPKRRTRAEILADAAAADGDDAQREKPHPVFVRYVQSRQGARIGVPEEVLAAGVLGAWAGEQAGATERNGEGPLGVGRMVEEVA
ncbi:hypothetical protein H2199_002963 [Coniosporium tulheliwenetii]|uniref:Uncharacterized protein n=1 Tax=Coniosporium tulheliwenetii TaxID=3383036 RepID=A0ACC2ZEL8_9PEZI|nr:hypothetical protein H2199_002963 [Cladosporium sp. JES 115]